MGHRIATSSSAYLRQHAHQQVDWWPYADEAFEQARLRDVPVMLSIGYAACHWCHVMSHESFDDPQIAQKLNENFISIKVDREQHPLVDDTYMMATQALTGSGGWPMTIFAMPDGRTFHAGTYYPSQPRGKTPSFTQVLDAVHQGWEERREALEDQATMLATHLADLGARQSALLSLHGTTPVAEALATASEHWISSTKPEGGFTPAPKFPPSWALQTFLRTVLLGSEDQVPAFEAFATTTEAILLGGLQDHLEGGFARYCVDERWGVPHFEKMLYDNAGLLSLCARTSVLAQWLADSQAIPGQRAQQLADFSRSSALNIVAFLQDKLLTGNPGQSHRALASSLDADSKRDGHSVEGAAYTFTQDEVSGVHQNLAAHLMTSMVRMAEVAEDRGHYQISLTRYPQSADLEAWEEFKTALRGVRSTREPAGRDDKVIAGWNGLAIQALAEASVLLEAPQIADLASMIATTLWEVHWDESSQRLARISSDRVAAAENEATLQDYAATALGFQALEHLSEENPWGQRAEALLARAESFLDPDTGAPRDCISMDPRLSAQRAQVAPVTVLDDALPAAGALYAKALARQALRAMADGDFDELAMTRFEQAQRLSAHAVALASEVPTQVATALEVQAVLNCEVHYVNFAGGTVAERAQLRRVCLALGIEARESAQLPTAGNSLQIQPCRKELCLRTVTGIPAFIQLLQAG